MTTYLASSFSLQMLPQGGRLEVKVLGLLAEHIFHLVGVEETKGPGVLLTGGRRAFYSPAWECSVVGHEGTARTASTLLEVDIPVNRESITLKTGDILWVLQPTGKRLSYGEEVDCPELNLFEVKVLGPKVEKTLGNYWGRELVEELNRRGIGPSLNPAAYEEED